MIKNNKKKALACGGVFLLLCFATILFTEPGISANDRKTVYGEMWNYTSAGWTFDITQSGIYENMTGLAPGKLKGFKFVEDEGHNELMVEWAGTYQIDFAMSFSGQTQSVYGIAVAQNHDVNLNRNCYARRAGGKVGSISLTCIMELNEGDDINIQIEDEDNPPKDPTIYTLNLNVERIDK